ncbi:MAG: hypothetical protein RBS43_10175 [Candidatus Cloacimonas sp.]|jgi:hypothetical protein|nr:hypothetical protein [Candidatus Cloacimonas sp.]
MKQFKALLIKEWRTHWVAILTPLWFTAGIYGIALLGIIFGLLKGGEVSFVNINSNIPAGMADYILWTSTAGITMILGAIGIISTVVLTDSMLNGGFKRHCEILHLSQPVKVSKILFAKYLLLLLGTIILVSVLSLVNSLVVSAFFKYYVGTHIYIGLCGWMYGAIEISMALIFVTSLFWFFAGLFKHKPFFMGTLSILAIEIAIRVLNSTAGLEIPSLFKFISSLSMVNIRVNPEQIVHELANVNAMKAANGIQILNLDNALRLILGAFFYFAGLLLYKNRELS